MAVGALGLAWWWRPEPVDVSTLDLEHAAVVLDIERVRLQDLSAALTPARQSSVASFASLQTHAADLSVIGLSWEEGAPNGPLQAMDLTLRFSGDPLNVPILSDGLYNLTLAMSVRSLELRVIDPSMVLGTVVVRFWRPVELDLDRVPEVPGLERDLTRLAAQVAVAEAARDALSRHRSQQPDNQRWLMTSLPTLILSREDGVLSAGDE